MNKLLLTTAIALTLGSTAIFAHHPAEFLIKQEGVWDMIDENVSDTPHADMTFDDMGVDADVGSVMGEDVGAAENQLEENNAMADSDSPGPGPESQR